MMDEEEAEEEEEVSFIAKHGIGEQQQQKKLTENSRQLRKLSIQVISPKSFPVSLVHLPGQCSIIALHISTTAPIKRFS